MKTDQFPWEEIFKDSARLLSESLANEKKPISKVSELYKALEKDYKNKGKPEREIPGEVSFRRKLHKKLNIAYEQRIYKSALYQLIGKYYNMTIPALAQHLTMTPVDSHDNLCYLFLRVQKGKRSISENKKILYATCKQLKIAFPDEIMFLSYDDDTIVMMCPNKEARKKVKTNIEKYIPKEDETDVG